MSRHVVITGLGTVCALGTGIDALWQGLVEGRSGLGTIDRIDASGFRSSLGGEVPDFSAKNFVPKHYRKAVKVMARDTELAVGAALVAVKDAGLATRATIEDDQNPTYPASRVGCQIGAGLIAAETDELAPAIATATDDAGTFREKLWGTNTDAGGTGGMNNLQPLWLLKYLPNMLACHVTILHGCEGPSNTITCAEASGLLSLGESLRVIQRDDADACFSGGAESKLNLMGMARLELAGRLAPTTPDDATHAADLVRPFDPDATGTLAAEGGGVVILEEARHAQARGATSYAEVLGFGAAQGPPPFPVLDLADADDLHTGESPSDGLRWAIESALADAGISADDIDAIVPTGSGIRDADAIEADALRAVFGERLASVPLVTIRPSLGDCQAGNGALQIAVAAQCLRTQQLPARLHAGTPAAGLDAGAADARPAPLRRVLVCSSSLGGQSAAVVLGRAAPEGTQHANQG
ncbi:MAG: beta-ketoacyl-[acyl-carrier-protein] synthase family protein [Phycisphaerales bacterium JB054]